MLEVRGYSSRPSPARLSVEEVKKMLALGVPLKVGTIYTVWDTIDVAQVFRDLLENELNAISHIPTDRDQVLRYVKDELNARPTHFHHECEGVLLYLWDRGPWA